MKQYAALSMLYRLVDEEKPTWVGPEIDRAFQCRCQKLFHKAYHGSMSAVIKLLERALPDWKWVASSWGGVHVTPRVQSYSSLTKTAKVEDNPARAILIAIMKVLMERTKERV